VLDWTISFGPITIGDAETLPAVNFTNLDVLSMPEIRSNDLTLIQRDGYWAGDDYMGGRTISLALEVQAKSVDEFNAANNLIARAFSPGVSGEIPFSFKIPGLANGREAYINARARRRSAPLDASFARLYCAYEVELFATDPIIYAAEETVVTIRNGTPSGPPARISVEGSRTTSPKITFTNVVNPRIVNAITNVGTTYTGSGTWTVDGPNYIPGERFLVLSDTGTPKDGDGRSQVAGHVGLMADYTVYLYDTMTQTVYAEIPFSALSYDYVMDEAGSATVELPIAAPKRDGNPLTPEDVRPIRTGIAIQRGTELVWGGLVWTYRLNLTARTIALSARGYLSYYAYRHTAVLGVK
jgi:hypothetical protein